MNPKPLPAIEDLERDFEAFAALPLEEIARRAEQASVPADVLARAKAKLQEH